jgi:hypothetical protein
MLAMISRLSFLSAAGLLLFYGVSFAKGQVENGRYYSGDGEFSVDLDRLYRPTKETSTGRITTVDFPFNPPATIVGLLSVRTIEWFKLDSVVPKEQYEATAKWLIEDHKAHRFHDQNFEVKNARYEFDARVPEYEFLATGRYLGSLYAWHGIVFFFGNRVALVSEVVSPAKSTDPQRLEMSPSFGFTAWARSLAREGRAKQQ